MDIELLLVGITALAAVVGVVYSALQTRAMTMKQANDRAEFYGRITAVLEGLQAESARHAAELVEIKQTQARHGNVISILADRSGMRPVDSGTPGV